jgi:biotin carboxylase
MKRPSVLILGVDRRQALAVIRSLGKAGYRVVAGSMNRRSPAQGSRYVDDVIALPPLCDTAETRLLEALEEFAERRPGACLYPVGDPEIELVARHRARLSHSLTVAAPNSEAVAACLDKLRTLELVHELDVPCAPFMVVASPEGLQSAAARLGLPCVVKAVEEGRDILGRKAYVVRRADQLDGLRRAWPKLPGTMIVQRFAPGLRHNVCYFACEGRWVSGVEIQVTRTDRIDGTGLGVDGVSVPLDEARKSACVRLIERLNYSGAGCVQFLVDGRTGEFSFLEVNARLDANVAGVIALGLDLPRLQVELAHGAREFSGCPRYPLGRRFAWLWGDLRGLKDSLRNRWIAPIEAFGWCGRMLLTNLSADSHITWSWDDPRPTITLFSSKAIAPLSRRGDLPGVDLS